MAKLTIDGREVTVPDGTSVIEAAATAGITIPHYCYHPKLSVAGNCRMCLVDLEGSRKPEISCNTTVREGMVVRTNTPNIQKLRKGVQEFLFLNHPIDCPICDKAGECKLQDYYLAHGKYVSRLEEGKVRKPKRLDIGNHIILDAERCVMCSRCIRFCDEVTKTGELRFSERGSHTQIGIHPDKRLNNRYSMCTADICPVGALTAKPFRFKARVWYLERTPSICTGCSNGCNIEIHHYRGTVHRYMPRRNDFVNDTWMCDDGRLTYQTLQGGSRIRKASVLEGASRREVDLNSALEKAARDIKAMTSKYGMASVGFVLSPRVSMEDNWLLLQLRNQLASDAPLYLIATNPPGVPEGDEDDLLIKADKNPNTQGARLLASGAGARSPGQLKADLDSGKVRGVVVLGDDIFGKVKSAPEAVAKSFEKLELVVSLETFHGETSTRAQVVLPLSSHAETDGTFVNHALRVQRFFRAVDPVGDSRPGWELIPALARALGTSLPSRSAAQTFDALCADHPHLTGITFETLGDAGVSLKGTAASAA